MWTQSVWSSRWFTIERDGFTLSELLLSLVIAGLILLTISGVYNLQTRLFDRILSRGDMLDDLTVAMASFKRYCTLAENVVYYVNDDEIGIRTKGIDGVENVDVYWRIGKDGGLYWRVVPESTGVGTESKISSLVVPGESGFVWKEDPDTGVKRIVVRLTLEDRFGQRAKRWGIYRLECSSLK